MHSVKHPYQEYVKNLMRFCFITLRDVLLTLYLKIVFVAKNSNMPSGQGPVIVCFCGQVRTRDVARRDW
jgi:hypothetical protein